jgi:peptidoglycan hydrolase-like protein with peptidoglycan-binding domain
MRILGALFAVLLLTSGALVPDPSAAKTPSEKAAAHKAKAKSVAARTAARKPARVKKAAPIVVGPAAAAAMAAASNAAPAKAPEVPATTGSLPPATPAITEPGIPRSTVIPPSAKGNPALRDSYAAISSAERFALQSDLVWTGNYDGPITGEFSDQLVAAVKAFQKHNKTKQTGVLNPQERAALIAIARPLQEQAGWRLSYDSATGARLGLPTKFVPNASPGKTGSLWSSAQGQVRIETFRINEPGTTLATVLAQQKIDPVERKIEHQAVRPDVFVLAGMQGLKKFHVRAYARNGEVRGITILYDQAMDGTMDPLVAPISSTFLPFASNASVAQDGAISRRKVEYGTGLVVSAVGHIVTDRQVIEACQVITIPGLGHAERLAEDQESNLALLRVYGAEDLVPLALLGEAAKGPSLTLVGIADPQAQAGGAAISTATAKLNNAATGAVPALDQAPALGFAGAAALDGRGQFFGMVGFKPTVVAGGASAAPRANVIPAEKIRNFIEAHYVAPTSGKAGVDNAKASVVRVICVRN